MRFWGKILLRLGWVIKNGSLFGFFFMFNLMMKLNSALELTSSDFFQNSLYCNQANLFAFNKTSLSSLSTKDLLIWNYLGLLYRLNQNIKIFAFHVKRLISPNDVKGQWQFTQGAFPDLNSYSVTQ